MQHDFENLIIFTPLCNSKSIIFEYVNNIITNEYRTNKLLEKCKGNNL